MRTYTIYLLAISVLFHLSKYLVAEDEGVVDKKKPVCINGICILPTGDTLPAALSAAPSKVRLEVVKDTSAQQMRVTSHEGRDEYPIMAVGSKNRLWMFWVSDRDGDNNLYSSCLNEARVDDKPILRWSSPLAVTKDKADNYNPVLTTDSKGVIWLAWCSKREGNYDVFVKRLDGDKWSEPFKVSTSTEDDMHPDITSDLNDNIWIVWYTWASMRGASRDRNIYAAYFNGKQWSAPKLMSPAEDHWDDHTDPAITADVSGRVWMSWSTDYHPQSYKNPALADGPTIFARSWAEGSFSDSVPPVPRNEFMIDYSPEMATDGEGRTWIVWEVSKYRPRRGRNVVSAFYADAPGKRASVKSEGWSEEMPITSDNFINADPTIAVGPKGRAWALWHSNRNGNYDVFASYFDTKWSSSIQITDSKEDETYPCAIVDKNGRYWIAWQARAKGNTDIFVRCLEVE